MTYFRLKKELNWSLRSKGIVVYEGNQKLQIAINTGKNNSEKVFLILLRWVGRQRLSPQQKHLFWSWLTSFAEIGNRVSH